MRLELPGHEVFTAGYLKWGGIENGELLRLAGLNGFEALVTNDRGLEYEQNLGVLPVAVVVVLAKANTIEAMRVLYPQLLAALAKLQARSFVKVALL